MDEQESVLCEKANDFVKNNWPLFKKKFADEKNFPSDEHPVSIFMAGSPGAGKTEISKRLIQRFTTRVVRIDADEIREMFDGYTGYNSFIFQSACTIAVNNLFGHCLKRKMNLILDATFSYHGSLENISESFKRNRTVEIYFIFQDPLVAWELTKRRERVEHRRVSKEMFIDSFLGAIEKVNLAKATFGDKLNLNLITKDFTTGFERSEFKIERLDGYLPRVYSRGELEKAII